MTKEELAEKYANEKAAEFTQAIKEAYLKGYEQGELQTTSTINMDGVEYVDLGLPSGTLWSKHPIGDSLSYRLLPYREASNLNIPTKDQFEELIKKCEFAYTQERYEIHKEREIEILGINGEVSIFCRNWDYYNQHTCFEGQKAYFGAPYIWLKSMTDKDGRNAVGQISVRHPIISRHFAGYKLPVFLVKNKSEL